MKQYKMMIVLVFMVVYHMVLMALYTCPGQDAGSLAALFRSLRAANHSLADEAAAREERLRLQSEDLQAELSARRARAVTEELERVRLDREELRAELQQALGSAAAEDAAKSLTLNQSLAEVASQKEALERLRLESDELRVAFAQEHAAAEASGAELRRSRAAAKASGSEAAKARAAAEASGAETAKALAAAEAEAKLAKEAFRFASEALRAAADGLGAEPRKALAAAEVSEAGAATAPKRSALLCWPTIPVPQLKGSDSRPFATLKYLVSAGYSVDLAFWRDLGEETRHWEGSLVEESSAMLLGMGVTLVGPLRLSGVLERVAGRYDLMIYWIWPDFPYLEWLLNMVIRFKREDASPGRGRAIACVDDAGITKRFLQAHLTDEEAMQWVLANRPRFIVGSDQYSDDVSSIGSKLPAMAVREGQVMLQYEMLLYAWSDVVAAISDKAKAVVEKMSPGTEVTLLPFAMPDPVGFVAKPFDERAGYLFVGYGNGANNAGIAWFLTDVFPGLAQAGHKFTIAGKVQVPEDFCKHELVDCVGAVDDARLNALAASARAAINPALESAGVATKTLRMLSYSTPVVSTEYDGTFQEGRTSPTGAVCRVRDADCFSTHLLELLGDGELWGRASQSAQPFVRRHFGVGPFNAALADAAGRAKAGRERAVLVGTAAKDGESMAGQNWHIANLLSKLDYLELHLMEDAKPAILGVVVHGGSQPLPPTGWQASLVIVQSWPPKIGDPVLSQYCGPGCRVAMILPWEFGHLPLIWVPPLVENFDEVWAPSEANRRIHVDSGIPGHQTRRVPCGIDCAALGAPAKWTPSFEKARKKDMLARQLAEVSLDDTSKLVEVAEKAKVLRFVFSGGLLPRKGLDVIVQAWKEVLCNNKDVHLTIHTSYELGYGPLEIRAMTDDMWNCHNTEWIRGHWMPAEEHRKMLQEADIYITAARSEGFGLPVVEAMALGKLVIAPVALAELKSPPSASADFFGKQTGIPVESFLSICKKPPCNERGDSICVFPPCDGLTCQCEELVGHATWFEPRMESMKEALKPFESGMPAESTDFDLKRGSAAEVARLFCWDGRLVDTYDMIIKDFLKSRSNRNWNRFVPQTSDTPQVRHRLTYTELAERPSEDMMFNDELILGYEAGTQAYLQGDGNFVVTDRKTGDVMRASGTFKECPCKLRLIRCKLALFDKMDQEYWSQQAEDCKPRYKVFVVELNKFGIFILKAGDARSTVQNVDVLWVDVSLAPSVDAVAG